MSTTVTTTKNCDFKAKSAKTVCGKPDDVEVVAFGLAEQRFEVDLCASHRTQVDEQLATLAAMSREVVRSAGSNRNTSRKDAAEIREWAKLNGFKDLSDRGRIPADVMDKYAEAQAKAASETHDSAEGAKDGAEATAS